MISDILFIPMKTHKPPTSKQTVLATFAGGHARYARATFAGGCFWCMVGPFEHTEGVTKVISGYTGGTTEKPTSEGVYYGNTGHVEAVHVSYDPTVVSYETLLGIFWRNIDPTDEGGQFADRGSSYRTAIFYHDEEQRTLAEDSKKKLAASGKFNSPVVTEIRKAGKFYPAEDYHQQYYKKHPERYQFYRQGSGREEYFKRTNEQKNK